MAEYISRAYALEVIRHISEDEPWQEACVNNVIRLLNELPSIDIVHYKADRATGEWVDIGGVIRYGCPFCHHAQEEKSNFCPNCGADMRGEA